ncbi:MAG: hypothetical protein CSA75_00285 [Sorangium cellulosum]|nr:MAG: hypothetical protein CSA75_00285 [Sorangium cellulosum]
MNRLIPIALMLACAMLVTLTQPPLFKTAARVRAKDDVYSLPPPKMLAVASLGYRSALADYLWAHVLVTQGLRLQQRRPFSELVKFFDAINYLDPKFQEPYRMADSLFSFQVNDPNRMASSLRARKVMERGLLHFPYDAELWLNYGQFLAYIGPSTLPIGSNTRDEWRADGAQALVRAAELGGADDTIVFKSISAATILNRSGKRDAAIRFLERAYAMTEDETLQKDIQHRLSLLKKEELSSRDFDLAKAFDELWRTELPFASRTCLSVLGPSFDVWNCAGPSWKVDARANCPSDWTEWTDRVLKKEGRP